MDKISTIVITYNEETNIERCLRSVDAFSDEIIVVDSRSNDRTVEIARERGARVIERDWPGYGVQRQFALEQASNKWIFSIDADEVVSPELSSEIQALNPRDDGYEMPRPVWYMNRWIKHGVWYPGYILRLFHKDKARVSDNTVHESVLVDGRVGRLKGDLLHYSYRDLDHHIEKINDFTTISAREMADRGRRAGVTKIVFYPLFEFLKTYVIKRGFMDGLAGFVVAILHSFYVSLKYAKLFEVNFLASQSAETDEGHDSSSKTPVE